MVLIFTHKISPRLRYIFKHIFTRILLIDIDFTSKIERLVAHKGPKLSYTNIPLGSEFFIKSYGLLFEQGINDVDITVSKWDDIPCFFSTKDKSVIPFDIFSASFYLITRYEEYLPHVKDSHGRFTANQSLAFKNNFLELPIIDVWAYKFLKIFKEIFPDFKYKKRLFNFVSTINIDNTYAYKSKSFVRTIGGFLYDLCYFKIFNIINRFAVNFNIIKDPYDTFEKIISYKKEFNIKTIFFFSVGDYSNFDTNISPSKKRLKLLIKDMVDYALVGIQASYYTMRNANLFKKEKERLEVITHVPIIRSRQHYLRFSLPETYQKLIDLEIKEDYSMGYVDYVGFRASTCTPFYFYNIDFEIQTPLKVFPFAIMDSTLNDYMKLTPKQSLGKIRELKNHVENVNGTFITFFHNESLSGYLRWRGWKQLYKLMLKIVIK